MERIFRSFSQTVSSVVGSPIAFFLAILIIVTWALTGKFFQYSDTWQLVINTGTTIVTFLIVFLIQNTQNRDTKAINLKLDELIYSIKSANNKIMDVEDLSDGELEKLEERFKKIANKRQTRPL